MVKDRIEDLCRVGVRIDCYSCSSDHFCEHFIEQNLTRSAVLRVATVSVSNTKCIRL